MQLNKYKPTSKLLIALCLSLFSTAHAIGPGGLSGGGLSDSKNVTLDSKGTNIQNLRGYNQVVVPILTKIQTDLPLLYIDIQKALRTSIFYLIDVKEIQKISLVYQAVPLKLDETQQTAFNNLFKEVWLVEKSFTKKLIVDAGTLLAHEMFMLDLLNKRKPVKLEDWQNLHSTVRRLVVFTSNNLNSDHFSLGVHEIYSSYLEESPSTSLSGSNFLKVQERYSQIVSDFKALKKEQCDAIDFQSISKIYRNCSALDHSEATECLNLNLAPFQIGYSIKASKIFFDNGTLDDQADLKVYPGHLALTKIYQNIRISMSSFLENGLILSDIKSINFYRHAYDYCTRIQSINSDFESK